MVFSMKKFFFLLTPIFLFVLFVINPLTLKKANASGIASRIFNLQIEGDPSIVWFEKGKILYKIMAWPEAAAAFSNSDSASSKNIKDESLYLRADSLLKTGNYSEAKSYAEKIQKNSRFYANGLYTKAVISLNTGNVMEASDYLEQILKIIPDSTALKGSQKPEIKELAQRTHLLLGFILMGQDNHEDAVRHFSLIPEDSPLYPQALYGSGWAYAKMGKWVRTVIPWEKLIQTSPDSTQAREVMPYIGHAYTTLSAYGKALEQNGNAIRYYEQLIKKSEVLETAIQNQDIKGVNSAIEIIGDSALTEKLALYNGLASMEEDIKDIKPIILSDADPIIADSINLRKDILNKLTESLKQDIKDLKHTLLVNSAYASIEMARNLHFEGGGRINNDMIFNIP